MTSFVEGLQAPAQHLFSNLYRNQAFFILIHWEPGAERKMPPQSLKPKLRE